MWLIAISFLLLLPINSCSRPQCGGTLTAVRGIIQTPGFPHEFPVPISCEWIIEASDIKNSSIIVYLTQVYVLEGLKFEEYKLYDRSYGSYVKGKLLHSVTESNITKFKWIQTHENYLVITFKLGTIESTHLRVLDNLLDVYGFNITYEITTAGFAREDSCIMSECGFTGVCYDHYTKFSCDCFPGYSGPKCSGGPNSICNTQGSPVCKNGATCTHVGATFVKCHCPKGYTGEKCHIPETTLKNDGCDDCLISCPFDGKPEHICKCPKGRNVSIIDRNGYMATLHLSNFPFLKEPQLHTFVERQIEKNFKQNVSRIEDLRITRLIYSHSGAEVTFHFNGLKKDEKRIKLVLAAWANRGYIANITVIDKDFTFNSVPRLSLQAVSVNQVGLIREDDEFILSCVAQGSPNMSFRWFKDGLFVNVTPATSYKWTRLIKDPHITDKYTALLGIDKASGLDQGTFTCQVEDYGIQQCLTTRVVVRKPPEVKIEPMSLTVQKGENFTIKCICTSNKTSGNKYTYSWTKNKVLLPIKTETERYEILYPGGSILQVSKVDKPVTYSCLVQDEIASAEVNIQVDVVDRHLVHTCLGEKHLDVLWPETAPGTDNVQECPKGFAGIASRACKLLDAHDPIWQLPDFSSCTSNTLINVNVRFQRLRSGYEQTTALETLAGYKGYLNGQSKLLPGEGARILTLVRDVIYFINSSKDLLQIDQVTHMVFDIVNNILTQKQSLMNERQIILLQQIVKEQALLSKALIKPESVFQQAFATIDVSMVSLDSDGFKSSRFFQTLVRNAGYSNLTNGSSSLIAITYANLSSFLPSRSVLRTRDGLELEYEIITSIVAMWLVKSDRYQKDNVTFVLEFNHPPLNSSMDIWNINCASSEFVTFGNGWDVENCVTALLNSTTTRCSCVKPGTFALLLTTKPTPPVREEDETHQFVALIGCVICWICSLLTGITLLGYWMLRKSCLVFLKVQCCLALIGATTVFTYALSQEVHYDSFIYVTTLLEISLLISLTSHLSKLLIVYTELVQLPRMGSLKQTVIAITTGVPVIAVFGNHLAHRSMGNRLESWWLIQGSLSFNIFVTCFAIISILFVFLYVTVMKKLKYFVSKHNDGTKALLKRVDLLQRASYIFTSTGIMIIASLFHINLPNHTLLQYVFSASSLFLGIILLLCYVLKSETSMRQHFLRKLNPDKEDDYFSSDSANSPLNYEPEIESESAPKLVNRSKTTEALLLSESHSKYSDGLPGTIETYIQSSSVEKCDMPHQFDKRDDLERYNSSPKQYRKAAETHQELALIYQQSPDILATRVCVELDLVASSVHNQCDEPVLVYNIAVDSGSCNPSDEKRVQPEGREKFTTKFSEGDLNKSDNLDGMLDRISHDLDYLLNREPESEMVVPSVSRKISKPPGASVIEQIEEESEDDVKVPESITDILRTTC